MATIDLNMVHLDKGSHRDPSEGHCLLEVVALFAKEPFSDAPECVSPVLRQFGINLNDQWDDAQRQKLVPFIPRLVGTADDGQDEARGYLALDWLIRTYTPTWLDLAGLSVEAQSLRDLRRIVDLAVAQSAEPVVRGVQTKATVAWDAVWDVAGAVAWAAAWDAAWAAAGAAAGAAAWDAAWAVARAVAWDVAWAAAGAAAGDAARAAARAALRPTVELLQASALDLFNRMIDPAGVAS